jgi:hypothetical protein
MGSGIKLLGTLAVTTLICANGAAQSIPAADARNTGLVKGLDLPVQPQVLCALDIQARYFDPPPDGLR